MSWPVTDAEHLRMEFVMVAREPAVSRSEACRQFRISRKTGYKWLRRYEAAGLAGLADRSRRPVSSPLQASGDVVAEIIRLRVRHRHWGPKKLRATLARRGPGPDPLPSLATVGRVLRRSGLSETRGRGRPRRNLPAGPLSRADGPNAIWTVDFKGWWRTRDGSRCEPLTIRDLYSRYILCLRPIPRCRTENVRTVFEEVFARYGLPLVIRSDNGAPFASLAGPHGLTRLSAWWRALGIRLERIDPGRPQQNGSHERMHRDLADEIQRRPGRNLADETARLERWRDEYNRQRPHEALAMKTPAELYRLSERRLQAVTPYVYPLDFGRRRVRRDGCILLAGQTGYLSEALGRMDVGLEPLAAGVWRVWFCDLPICEFHSDGKELVRRPVTDTPVTAPTCCNPCPDNKVLPMS